MLGVAPVVNPASDLVELLSTLLLLPIPLEKSEEEVGDFEQGIEGFEGRGQVRIESKDCVFLYD